MLHSTLRLRTLRKHFEALCAFVHLFKRQQKKLKYLDVKLRAHWTQLFLKRWRVNIEIKQERKLRLAMERRSSAAETQTHALGEAENKKEQLSQMLKTQDLAMRKKARHLIGNYFMRYYSQAT